MVAMPNYNTCEDMLNKNTNLYGCAYNLFALCMQTHVIHWCLHAAVGVNILQINYDWGGEQLVLRANCNIDVKSSPQKTTRNKPANLILPSKRLKMPSFCSLN